MLLFENITQIYLDDGIPIHNRRLINNKISALKSKFKCLGRLRLVDSYYNVLDRESLLFVVR